MPREKKDNVPISIRMEKNAYAELAEFCEISGQPKMVAIERAVKEYVKENKKKCKGLYATKEDNNKALIVQRQEK